MTPDLRLAVPAAAGWAVTAVLVGVPDAAIAALVAAWAAAAALAVLRPRLALVALAIALCCTSLALHLPGREQPELVAAAEEGARVTVTATLNSPGGGRSFEAMAHRVMLSDRVVRADVPVVVIGPSSADELRPGDEVEVSGELGSTDAGDAAAFLLFAENPPRVRGSPPWYLAWADGLRTEFLAATARLPGDGADLLAGLAIGDDSRVSAALDDAMTSSSLSHLTAVSGANCAIVVGLIMLAGGAVGVPRGIRVAASLVMLAGFVVLVTPQPSVLRAAVMATLVLLAVAGGRPLAGLPVLSLATILLLIADPWLSREYGFVLSVLSTAGLLVLAGPMGTALTRWMPHWLALVIAVPLAAQLACQPVVIQLDASLPTYGVVANLLAAPAAPIATIVGLAACVASALAPPIGLLLAQVAWLPSTWIAGVARFFADAPLARLPWPPGPVGVMLLVIVSALAIGAILGRGRWRPAVAGAVVLAAVAYLGVVGGGRLIELAGRPADWQIAACDVGQGDAVVVRSSGSVALIDTGPEPAPLRDCLSELGIDRVDMLVLTHFDLDHVGGVTAVADIADRVLVGPSGGPPDDRIVADLVAAGAEVDLVARGATGTFGDLAWRVLWPPPRLAGMEPGNEASVTVEFVPVGRCGGGCLGAVFLGDLGEAAQDRMLGLGPIAEVEVVKVSHHGSSDQSERLYARLGAVVGVIGVGADNGYGHPTRRALDLLSSTGTAVARTDLDGLVLLAPGTEPGAVTVWTER